MRLSFLIIVLFNLIILFQCANDLTGGATDAESGGIVTGIVIDDQGNPLSDVYIYLEDQALNPFGLEINPKDITDKHGAFTFTIEDTGNYALSGYLINSDKRFLVSSVRIDNAMDTIDFDQVTIKNPGSAIIGISDSVHNKDFGYFYIPGTKVYHDIAENKILTIGNVSYVVFNNIPEGNIPEIKYCEEIEGANPISIWYKITINEMDTVDLLNSDLWSVFNEDNSELKSNFINTVLIDSKEKLWVGTDNYGVYSYDGSNWENFTQDNSPLPHNNVTNITEDRDGTIWVTTRDGVASYSVDSVWQPYTVENSDLYYPTITGHAIDCTNTNWFLSFIGCDEFNGSNWKFKNLTNEFPVFLTEAISVDKNNTLYIGTEKGLMQFDGNTWANITYNDQFQNSTIDMDIDQNNVCWLATSRGLTNYHNGKWNSFPEVTEQLSMKKLQCLSVADDNSLWLGSYFFGTIIHWDESVTIYSDYNTPILNGVSAINDIAVGKKALYFATENAGVIIKRLE